MTTTPHQHDRNPVLGDRASQLPPGCPCFAIPPCSLPRLQIPLVDMQAVLPGRTNRPAAPASLVHKSPPCGLTSTRRAADRRPDVSVRYPSGTNWMRKSRSGAAPAFRAEVRQAGVGWLRNHVPPAESFTSLRLWLPSSPCLGQPVLETGVVDQQTTPSRSTSTHFTLDPASSSTTGISPPPLACQRVRAPEHRDAFDFSKPLPAPPEFRSRRRRRAAGRCGPALRRVVFWPTARHPARLVFVAAHWASTRTSRRDRRRPPRAGHASWPDAPKAALGALPLESPMSRGSPFRFDLSP